MEKSAIKNYLFKINLKFKIIIIITLVGGPPNWMNQEAPEFAIFDFLVFWSVVDGEWGLFLGDSRSIFIWGFSKDDIFFGLCWNLRLVLEWSWRILVSFGRIFLKIIFLHGEIFEFSQLFFLNVNGKVTMWHTLV